VGGGAFKRLQRLSGNVPERQSRKKSRPAGERDSRSVRRERTAGAITAFLADSVRSLTDTRYYLARRVGRTPASMGWESQAVHLVPRARLGELLHHSNDQSLISAPQKACDGESSPGHRPSSPLARNDIRRERRTFIPDFQRCSCPTAVTCISRHKMSQYARTMRYQQSSYRSDVSEAPWAHGLLLHETQIRATCCRTRALF
jgi:hypothetical protein